MRFRTRVLITQRVVISVLKCVDKLNFSVQKEEKVSAEGKIMQLSQRLDKQKAQANTLQQQIYELQTLRAAYNEQSKTIKALRASGVVSIALNLTSLSWFAYDSIYSVVFYCASSAFFF